MKHLTLTFAAIAVLGLSACDKPTVVNVPAEPDEKTVVVPVPVPVPGPAGEKGEPGKPGDEGAQGEAGKQGEPGESGDTTIIVPPPENAPATP